MNNYRSCWLVGHFHYTYYRMADLAFAAVSKFTHSLCVGSSIINFETANYGKCNTIQRVLSVLCFKLDATLLRTIEHFPDYCEDAFLALLVVPS